MEAASNDDAIISLFQEVLRNERPFSSNWLDFTYLYDYAYELREPTSIAIFDMNGDGTLEMIVNFHYTIKLVLHYYDGKIHGSEFGIRSMNVINTDGTFFVSYGIWGFGIGELIIEEGETRILVMHDVDSWAGRENPYELQFYIDGELVSEEEFDARRALLLEHFDEKEAITWHPFTDENIENLANLVTHRYTPNN